MRHCVVVVRERATGGDAELGVAEAARAALRPEQERLALAARRAQRPRCLARRLIRDGMF